MNISLIADSLSLATTQGLGFAKVLLDRHDCFSLNYSISINSESSADNIGLLQVTASFVPVDTAAPPPVKASRNRTATRTLRRKKRRSKRRSFAGGDSDGTEYSRFFSDDGSSGGDGGMYGGGGGGGRGWGGDSWDGSGGRNWDESSSHSSWSSPALDFVYEVICWIALSNCVHFAFKKMMKIVADHGIGDTEREEVPIRLESVY